MTAVADRDALVLAALETLDWPDDRASAELPGAHWGGMAGVVDAVLTAAYWHLRDHADGYRAASPPEGAGSHRLHGWYARGIEAAARDLAELLGVEECEIERPGAAGGTR